MKFNEEVFCTLQVEATHNWPECPFDEVDFLRVPHRHIFHIKAYKTVTHSDRDVEFIMLKRQISHWFYCTYYVAKSNIHEFGSKSCEMIAKELIEKFDLCCCEVNEDGENGAIVTPVRVEPVTVTPPAFWEPAGFTLAQEPTTKVPLDIYKTEVIFDPNIECEICGNPPTEGCKTC